MIRYVILFVFKMHFHIISRFYSQDDYLEVTMLCRPLSSVAETSVLNPLTKQAHRMDLGVIVDNELDFKQHCDSNSQSEQESRYHSTILRPPCK